MSLLAFRKNVILLVIIAGIFGGLLIPVLSFNVTFATSESEGVEDTGGDGDSDGGGDQPEPEPEPEPGLIPGPEPPIDPCEENPEAEGCEPAPVPTPRVPEPPDDDCLYDPSLPKCAPIDGECPEGFNMNEDGQCFPDKPCPTGFERRDEDETGRCYPIGDGSPSPIPEPTPVGNETTPTTNQTTPTSPKPDILGKIIAIYTIHNGKVYVIEYASPLNEFNRYLPTFSEIVRSFRFPG